MRSFPIAILLVFSGSACAAHPTMEDLLQALNMRSRSWNVFRSYERQTKGEKNICVYHRKTSLTRTNYDYEHWYKHGHTWARVALHGTLLQDETGPLVMVNDKKGNKISHHLLHWDRKTHCSVFTFLDPDSGNRECDLYVWEEDIRTQSRAYPCEHEYDNLCPKSKKYQIYTEWDCRHSYE